MPFFLCGGGETRWVIFRFRSGGTGVDLGFLRLDGVARVRFMPLAMIFLQFTMVSLFGDFSDLGEFSRVGGA